MARTLKKGVKEFTCPQGFFFLFLVYFKGKKVKFTSVLPSTHSACRSVCLPSVSPQPAFSGNISSVSTVTLPLGQPTCVPGVPKGRSFEFSSCTMG